MRLPAEAETDSEFRLECSEPIVRKATISPCGTYRYVLTRRWASGDRVVNWILLNPSTADGATDDPTVRYVDDFSRRWGFDALVITNLYALRSTDPEKILIAKDPIGPDNDRHLIDCAQSSDLVVCGWGNFGTFDGRGRTIRRLLADAGVPLYCLGTNDNGEPSHPLYLPATRRPTVMGGEVANG
jgi:hypothetical protein